MNKRSSSCWSQCSRFKFQTSSLFLLGEILPSGSLKLDFAQVLVYLQGDLSDSETLKQSAVISQMLLV